MSEVKVDQYGNKLSEESVNREVKARKIPSIQELFAEDCAKRKAQTTDVTPDGEKERDDLVVDANDDLNKFLKNQDKDNNDSQDVSILFDMSSDANDNDSKFVSDQNKTDKNDVKDQVEPSEDGREEYVSETKPDDLSGFESNQRKESAGKAADDAKKAKEAADKKKDKKEASVEKKVKARWGKLIGSIMFDPFQLQNTKKKIVAFAIGKDYVLMPSEKPTRTEWKTAQKVVAELRDPSIIRKATLVKKAQMEMEDEELEPVDVDVEVEGAIKESPEDSTVIEETVAEEKEEVAKLEDVVADLEAGDVDSAKEKLQECISKQEEEIEEAVEDGEGGEEVIEDVEVDEDILPEDTEVIA